MKIRIEEIPPERLSEYQTVPSAFTVRTIFEARLIDGGLGGIQLLERPVEPYTKDYDAGDERVTDWPKRFDVKNWKFLLAKIVDKTIGAATVAVEPSGVFMLENRKDLAVLWDIRVRPEWRGAGIALFRYAARWSREHNFRQMKIETQNINIPACRFYQRMGASLGEIHLHGYAAIPAVSHEVMLNWYLDLTKLHADNLV